MKWEGVREERKRRRSSTDGEEVVFSSLPDPPLLSTGQHKPPTLLHRTLPALHPLPKRALDREKRSPLAARATYTTLSQDSAIQCHFYFTLASNPLLLRFLLSRAQFHFDTPSRLISKPVLGGYKCLRLAIWHLSTYWGRNGDRVERGGKSFR